MASSLLSSCLVQIELAPQTTSRPATGTGEATVLPDVLDGGHELLDDFLERLQSIVRKVPAAAPHSLDDTRPSRGSRSRA